MKSIFGDRRPKVLLTGAAGNVGSRAIMELGQTMDLRLTDIVSSMEDTRYVKADLTDFSQVYSLMEGMDAVIHLAIGAMEGGLPPQGQLSPGVSKALNVNINSTYHILEAARQWQIRRVVYASSLTVLLGDKHRAIYDKNTPLEPTNLYACSKLFGEQLAKAYWRSYQLSTLSLRLGQPFPIGHVFDDAWRGSRRARSAFAEIGDVARGLACAVHTDVPFGIFNLVSASDNQRVDISETKKIGYVPRAYLSDEGIQFFDDGNFPLPGGEVVTHDPDGK